jgi:hypothetical protein
VTERSYRIHAQTFTARVTVSRFGLVSSATLEAEHLVGWHERKFFDYCWQKGWRVVEVKEKVNQ